jgi:PAS domain S-box-containing protein
LRSSWRGATDATVSTEAIEGDPPIGGDPAVEEALRIERRARVLLQAVAVAAARSTDLVGMLQALLKEVCVATGWPLGHALERDGDALVSSRVWHLEDAARFAAFRAATEAHRFERGIGLPGRVLASGRPHWVMDVQGDDNFPRRAVAIEHGLHAALAFPVIAAGEVVMVLEFASVETVPPDLPLLEVMATLGTQLGWIAERARAEAALRESELRLRNLTESANDAIVTADADGRIISWNRCAERIFGYTPEEALGQPLTLIIPERFRPAHDEGMARARAGGERRVIGRTVELAGLRKDGAEFPIELSLSTWQTGPSRYYSGILRDITERKAVEERLRATTARLERSERAAVEASKAKSLFLANMSHELRTPLNAILGFVQLLERDRGLTAQQCEHLGIISRSGEHLLGLINDVLSVAKIEAGEAAIHAGDFDLPRLLGSLREMFHLRAQARGLRLVFDHAADLPRRVHGDEGKLRQVLINLLGNAVKFTEKGGVALRARWIDGRAAFEVEDTGAGIAEAELAGLFEPFVQAGEGRKAAEGTGLGLSISRDFVRLMGGELQVRSAPGAGSCFSFDVSLPVAATTAPERDQARVIGLAPGQERPTVLVVDNADDNRLLLSRLLQAVGCSVREAVDGRKALEVWRTWRPSFVWMDMRMPEMDGYQATRAIREEEAGDDRPRTVVVALTASAFEHDRASILAAGCDEILAKPFREDRVFETLTAHLGVRWARAEAATIGAPPEVESLSPERLRGIPPTLRAALERSLAEGDDLGAQRAVDAIAEDDSELAAALGRLVRGFRFDELLGILERA